MVYPYRYIRDALASCGTKIDGSIDRVSSRGKPGDLPVPAPTKHGDAGPDFC